MMDSLDARVPFLDPAVVESEVAMPRRMQPVVQNVRKKAPRDG
jgi:hypothetical protein